MEAGSEHTQRDRGPSDRRAFQRFARWMLERGPDNQELGKESFVQPTGDSASDAAALENLILTRHGSDTLEAVRQDAATLLRAMEQVTDFASLAEFDGSLKATLDRLALAWFSPIPSSGEPLTLSAEELRGPRGAPYRDFVCGPTIDPRILVDVIGTLRQVGVSVVGVYESVEGSQAWIYYRPKPSKEE